MTEDDPLYFWRLAPELTIVDAAILIAGGDPSITDAERDGPGIDFDWIQVKRTTGHTNFTPVFTALKSAIVRGELPAKIRYRGQRGGELEPSPDNPFWIVTPEVLSAETDPLRPSALTLRGFRSVYMESEPNWDSSSVEVTDLRSWLQSRGHMTGFFFPPRDGIEPDAFTDTSHEHFSSELALAIEAWRALATEQKFPRGTKEAIGNWIDAHPASWKGDGELSASARDRIITLVNWRKSGGAPPTGG